MLALLPVAVFSAEQQIKERRAREYLASIDHSPKLQSFLDQTVNSLLTEDAKAAKANLRIAVIDLNSNTSAQMAHWHGNTSVYPASVVKFVYLIAAYSLQEQGRLNIDPGMDKLLTSMIYNSSNKATQKVVARVTETEPGATLSAKKYKQFRSRRLSVKRWLESLGVKGIHSIHPTYDGGGDLTDREMQLLQDSTVKGGLASPDGQLRNRQAMTAIGTAELLALLATDRALNPENSRQVRNRMIRDPIKQTYQRHRIAGGALKNADFEVYSKTGTWGPIFADAGIIHHSSGRQAVLAVFIESRPAYRGSFIAALSERVTEHLFAEVLKP